MISLNSISNANSGVAFYNDLLSLFSRAKSEYKKSNSNFNINALNQWVTDTRDYMEHLSGQVRVMYCILGSSQPGVLDVLSLLKRGEITHGSSVQLRLQCGEWINEPTNWRASNDHHHHIHVSIN